MRYLKCLVFIAQLAAIPAWGALDFDAETRVGGRKASPRTLVDSDRWIGIVGDSGVTGAASSPNISANVFTLLNQFSAMIWTEPDAYRPPELDPLTRIYRGEAEVGDVGARASRLLDVPEHSFGYQLARAIGVDSADVVLVGQDGKRVSAIPTQLARLFEMDTRTLPPLVLVSFTANDFCDLGVLEESVGERARRFRRSLETAWDEARPSLIAHPRGTQFVVLAPLEVANVLTNPGLLDQEVPLGTYGTVTCGQMRAGEIPGAPIAEFVADRLIGMCPSVLGTRVGDVARVRRLRDVQNAFDRIWTETIAKLNADHAGSGLHWDYVPEVRALEFERGDVAHDCFHPSARGHAKLADLLLRNRRTVPKLAVAPGA